MSDTGWGGKFWGASNWGDLGDEFVNTSSVSASYTINSVTVGGNATVVVSGLSLQTVIQGTVAGASADVVPTGLLITNTIGNSEGAPYMTLYSNSPLLSKSFPVATENSMRSSFPERSVMTSTISLLPCARGMSLRL